MAQAVRNHDIHSLWSHAQDKMKIQCPGSQEALVGQLSARELKIVWGSDCRYWKWTKEPIGCFCVDVAELLQVCWLEIEGKYPVNKLEEGVKYQVMFVVKLKDKFDIQTPTTLSLTLPDGCKQEHKECLMEKPRNQIIGIKAGEFVHKKQLCGCGGDITFSLMNIDSPWKHGLVVIGALISPVI